MRGRLVLIGCVLAAGAVTAAGAGASSGWSIQSAPKRSVTRRACAVVPAGRVSCDALVRLDAAGRELISRNTGPHFSPSGYRPRDLQQAYKLTAATPRTGTVAVVDAFDDPNAESDLAVYRKQFGLTACTAANGCFRKLNQVGAPSPLPDPDRDWAMEIALDLDMVSAICPHCSIILVEANNDSDLNVSKAAKKAASLAHIVSNSYGGKDLPNAAALYASYYATPGVQQVVAAGDGGFNGGPQIPAAFSTVTAVGGTSLVRASNSRGFRETVWDGGGSGCSVSTAKPAWQHDRNCKKRMIADVAAVADPSVAVYFSFDTGGAWWLMGGTSAATPIIAGIYALAGNAASIPNNASHVYANASHLFDVTVGSNGTCASNYECTAKPGYDGPTGLGTPNGIGAF